MTISLETSILTQTNFSALLTIEGMLHGYFTSPLIETYDLTSLIPHIKSIVNNPTIVARMEDAIVRQKKLINTAQLAGANEVVVGHYKIGGITVPRIEHRPLTMDDLARFR